jgi:hypothetical protein
MPCCSTNVAAVWKHVRASLVLNSHASIISSRASIGPTSRVAVTQQLDAAGWEQDLDIRQCVLTNANDILSAKRRFLSTIFLAAMASYLPPHDGLLPLFILFVRRIPKTTLLGALTKSPGRRDRPGQCYSSLHYSLLYATPLCRQASILNIRLHKDNQDNDGSFRVNLSSSG